MSASELIQWYDEERQRSDSQVIAENKRLELVEKRPAPLNLSDTEVLDFLGEYCSGFRYESACSMLPARFIIQCAYIDDTSGKTLREAACLAAAKLEEC